MYFKEFRISLKLTQKELGEKLGVSQTAIARYETNRVKPTTETIMLYVEKLDANPNFLFTGKGSATLSDVVDTDFNCAESLKNIEDILTQIVKNESKRFRSDTVIKAVTKEVEETDIAKKMKLIRTSLRYNQQDFADLLEVGVSSIKRYETGVRDPCYLFLKKIVIMFNIDPVWLFE